MTAALLSKPDAKRAERRAKAVQHIGVPLTINEWLSLNGIRYDRKRDLPHLIANLAGECLTDPQDLFDVDSRSALAVSARILDGLTKREIEYGQLETHWAYVPHIHAAIAHCVAAEKIIAIWYRRVLGARANAIKRSAAE
jgi:hypothetical protein